MDEGDDALLLAGKSLAELRLHFGAEDRFLPRDELFSSLRCHWDADCGQERAGNFLRAVAACELHDQLLSDVLQFHARDALDMLEELALQAVIARGSFARDAFVTVAPVLEALVAAAVTIALTVDTRAYERNQLRDEFERRIRAFLACSSRRGSPLRSVLTLLRNEEGDRDIGRWGAFEALPFELDSQLGATRSGRSRIQAMSGVLHQQQQALRVYRSTREQRYVVQPESGEVRGEEQSVADRLWRIARDLLAWIEERKVSANGLAVNDVDGTGEENGTERKDDQSLDLLLSEADLEAYLISSLASPNRGTRVMDVIPEPTSRLSGHKSRIQEVLEACSRDEHGCNTGMSSELLTAAYDELVAVRDVETLQVHVSYLLAFQLEAGRPLVKADSPTALVFERLIQRELNLLTASGASMETHLRSLLALSAFCPRRLVELVVRGALADSLHHQFYLNLLAACPLLVAWEDQQSQSVGELCVFKCELQRVVNEVISLSGQFEEQSRHVVAFLSGLIGISNRANTILPLPELLRDALLPQLVVEEDPVAELSSHGAHAVRDVKLFHAFSLVQQLLGRVVASSSSNLSSLGSTAADLFQRTIKAYASLSGIDSCESVRFREPLLFLVKDMLELCVSNASLPAEAFASALAPTLASQLPFDAAFMALVAPVRPSYLETGIRIDCKQDGDTLTLDRAKRSAELALWSLLWATLTSSSLASKAPIQAPELWGHLDSLSARTDIKADGSPAFQERVSGASVIHSAAASILLSCGESLMHSFRANLVPYLMKYEAVGVAKRGAETLALPFARDVIDNSAPEELVCSLTSTHCSARYFIRCWSLVALKFHRKCPDLLVQMMRGVVGACDSAVDASKPSLTQLLACFQWGCYLAFSAHELELDTQSSWPAVAAQLEMSLLRILHDLARLEQLPSEQATAASGFVAAWLSILPSNGSFASVIRYLQANRSKSG